MPLNIIPQSGQSLDETRDPIRDNFSYINNGFLVDHVAFNNGANSGKHQAVHLVNQQVAPAAPTTAAGECAIYAAPSLVAPNAPAIYIKGESSTAAEDGIEITYALKANPGWTQLPSGIIMQWGNPTISSGGTTTNFARTFPTACLIVNVTSANTGSDIKVWSNVSAKSTTGFTVRLRGANGDGVGGPIYYCAIGY